MKDYKWNIDKEVMDIGKIIQIKNRSIETSGRLVAIWHSAVQATHTFLSDTDRLSIAKEVQQAIEQISPLYVFYDDCSVIQGFIATSRKKIEMLFVHADAFGQGIGKMLVHIALQEAKARYVDVNEQNEQARGFYVHLGFNIIGRSETDSKGRPFPVLHMEKILK